MKYAWKECVNTCKQDRAGGKHNRKSSCWGTLMPCNARAARQTFGHLTSRYAFPFLYSIRTRMRSFELFCLESLRAYSLALANYLAVPNLHVCSTEVRAKH